MAVIITHVELLKAQLGYKNIWQETLIFNLGSFGVYFFFVLSGFLITYLLFSEKDFTGAIGIKNFYIRRVLRIWPLYYLLLIVAFFVLPHISFMQIPILQQSFNDNFNNNLLFFLLILPNLAFSIYPAVPHFGQAWSIGVEEQFYIFWPWLIKKTKSAIKAIVLFTVLIVLLKGVVLCLIKLYPNNSTLKVIKLFVAMSKLESMSIGAIGAWLLYYQKNNFLAILYKPVVQVLTFILIPLLIYVFPDFLQDGIHIVYSVLFLIVILNVSSNTNSILKLNHRVFEYLGKISYGIYMYHMIFIILSIKLIALFLPTYGPLFNLLIYVLSLLFTILVSGLSYYFFENKFIKLKTRFSKIMSGNSSLINQ
ncbi:MAG: acyltransferase [Bacteroidetes bacterium]|nr:acyltransferase [Bacteroidota bacterium]